MRKDVLAQVLAFLFMLSMGAHAQGRDPGVIDLKIPSIQVSGTGSVPVKPDVAAISIGVSVEDENAQSAVSRNSAATAKVIAELEGAGVEKKDIKTSYFSVNPQFRTEGPEKRQVITYRAANIVRVTIRDIGKAGDILAKVVAAGSNQINGPNFQVSEPDAYLDEARKKAVENAMSKARAYASAAGLKLGNVLAIIEEGDASPVAVRGAHFTRSPSVPIEAGEDTVRADILLIVELKP
jgi:hypothetical protein